MKKKNKFVSLFSNLEDIIIYANDFLILFSSLSVGFCANDLRK